MSEKELLELERRMTLQLLQMAAAEASSFEGYTEYLECIEHNQLELAHGILTRIGAGNPVSTDYWQYLNHAAHHLKPRKQYEDHFAFVREIRSFNQRIRAIMEADRARVASRHDALRAWQKPIAFITSYYALVPVALAIWAAAIWILTQSSRAPAPQPDPLWRATLLTLSSAIAMSGAVIGRRSASRNVVLLISPPISPLKHVVALGFFLALILLSAYHQFHIAITGHLVLLKSGGDNLHYRLTSSPIAFVVLYIGGASILGLCICALTSIVTAQRNKRFFSIRARPP